MHIKNKVYFLISILLITSAFLSGAYLTYEPVRVSQPDKTQLDLYASGDEYYNWLHDKEEYTIKQNDKGWYVYLRNNSDNELVFTDHIVGKVDPASLNLIPKANIAPKEMGQIRKEQQNHLREIDNGRAPSSGAMNNISIFIRFSDQTEFEENISIYNSIFNGTTGNTLQSYFLEASYNQLNISTTFYPESSPIVVSWQDSNPRAYYSPYSETNTIGFTDAADRKEREFTLLVNAVNGVSSQIPSDLVVDADGDGKVDNVVFIIKGGTDGWNELLWPHRWSLHSQVVNINGKRVYDFNFQLSASLASSGVGVACHEMFHSLSAPDLYHYTSDGISPVGPWDIMENNANPPQHMGAYMKHKYGKWIQSIPTISDSGTYTLNPLTSSTEQCYRIDSPNSSSEYFVVEFRKKTGTFESSVPASGMLIYRIKPDLRGNADGPPDEVYAFRPGGTQTTNGTVRQAHFSLETGRTNFDNTTNPYGFFCDGTPADISITSISSSADDTMSFYYNLNAAPVKLTAESSEGNVLLNWKKSPIGSPSSYNIYRNDQFSGSSTTLTYIDTDVSIGIVHHYNVTAMLTNPIEESPASNTASITISNDIVNIVRIIGTGTDSTSGTTVCPITVNWESMHGQSVYTKDELNALGVEGPIYITELGFNVTQLPGKVMPNYLVRMGHTSATNVAEWIPRAVLDTVWTAATYRPTTTGWDMLTLATPFLWNGTDNIVIDTAFDLLESTSISGGTQYTTVTNGYRYVLHSFRDQWRVFYGGSVSNNRPNVKLTLRHFQPLILVNYSSFVYGDVILENSSTRQFTIKNIGFETLTGSITTPTGYSVTEAQDRSEEITLNFGNENRNELSFNISAGTEKFYNLTFQPTAITTYNGNVVINSNSVENGTLNLPVTGTGYSPATINIDNDALFAHLQVDNQAIDSFTITNTGALPLTYEIKPSELRRSTKQVALGNAQDNRAITGSTLTLDAVEFTPGTTQDWTFTVYNGSTSAEWLKHVIINFPTNVTINNFTNFVGGTGGELVPTTTSNNGTTIDWYGSTAGNYGFIRGRETATATVNVSIDRSFEEMISLPFQIIGDEFGSAPHTLEGTLTVLRDAEYISWFKTLPLSGTIPASGNQLITSYFSSGDMAVGNYEALLTIHSNDPVNPILEVSAIMNVYQIITHLDSPIITSTVKTLAGIKIQWLPVQNARSYKVYRSFEVDGGFTYLCGSTSETEFVDTDFGSYPYSFYMIKATDIEY